MAHLLEKAVISNFKSIDKLEISLQHYNVMVGYNNAGKSNILKAISWLFKKSNLGIEYFNETTKQVSVEGIITGVDESIMSRLVTNQATAMQHYIKNSKLIIRRIQDSPKSSPKLQVLLENPDDGNSEWRDPPTGLEAGISLLFPEPIFINAMEDAAEDSSKYKTSTTIGKLLSSIFTTIQNEYVDTINQAFSSFQDLFCSSGTNRIKELVTFDDDVSRVISTFFPGLSIKAQIPEIEFKEILKSATISTFEEGDSNGKDISLLGHGAQRAIQMGLIKYLADQKRSHGTITNNTLLLVEEPELYMHPQAIDNVRDALMSLSNAGFQVLISTHSPRLVTKDDVRTTILVTKLNNHTRIRKTLLEAVSEVEKKAPTQLDLLFQLSNSSNILFSDRVLLIEGDTEYWIFEKMFEKVIGKPLSFYKTSIVKLRGCGDIKKTKEVLRVMDVPCKAIADLDFAFHTGKQQGLISDSHQDYQACKIAFQTLANDPKNRITLDNSGWPCKNDHRTAEEMYEILGNTKSILESIEGIHNHYKDQNIWVWKHGSFDVYLGLKSKNSEQWENMLEDLEKKPLENCLHYHQEVMDCMKWLIE
ncbi:MAG: AAA family ATPase [Candidatus Cloacimonadaceae bacterium]|nr:AAA family ATPase [Candidatus Cloacimonadota bacterium]MCB5257625.1 AAA family ATPase [Candidatus Cloacimonadota bacterium]MDD5624689.1 AAA family ATPase [Candidatus Cloacimonadota bacterium]